jgi:hypothetical protein
MTHVPQSTGTASGGRSWLRRFRVPLAAATAFVAAGTIFAADAERVGRCVVPGGKPQR